jgi:hypothetical protein
LVSSGTADGIGVDRLHGMIGAPQRLGESFGRFGVARGHLRVGAAIDARAVDDGVESFDGRVQPCRVAEH